MKRKLNRSRLLAALLSIVMLFCNMFIVNAADQEPSIAEKIEAQAQAVEANEILMQYFITEGWVLEYPDYFGGCYIEDNILHIRLVSPTSEESATLNDILSDYENVISYEYGNFSQTSIQNYANETAKELKNQGFEVTHWYVDVETCAVVIGVISDDVNSANALVEEKQTYSVRNAYPNIVIEEGEYTSPSSDSTVEGGVNIIIGSSSRSAGTCGYYEGVAALVTCGHGNTTVGSTVKLNEEEIGTVVDVQYTNGEAGDYSIIELNNVTSSHKIGNSTDGYITIEGGTYLSPAVGTYVTKYGYRTGYSYGTVTATNVSVTPATGTIITGMTQVSISQGEGGLPGDSGGPYLVGDAFCGVHHGNKTSNRKIVYFTPYSVISAGGFTAISEHKCLRWTDAGASNHSGYCTICKETVYESHSEYWDHLRGKCTRCGRTGQITVNP